MRNARTLLLLLLLTAALGVAGWSILRGEGAPRPWLVDVTAASGIRFSHHHEVTGEYRYLETVGGGVALFDYDGDGWLDIYFVNGNNVLRPASPALTNVLYRNNRDGTFTDVTAAAGVGDAGYGQGCAAGDYDNDGDQDLYVSNYGPDRLYRNDGGGRFTDVTATAGIDNPAFGQCCAFFDADGDGWLDLYVQNYVTYDPRREAPRTEYASPTAFAGAADLLYRNRGDGTFEEISRAAGIHRSGGRGMGLLCVDFDGDRRPDLFVANDAMENYYFANQGGGTFAEQTVRSGVAYNHLGASESSMGADTGDVDGDGRLDIVCPALRAEGCTLYLNRGGFFEDASGARRMAAATRAYTGFSPNVIDIDNDGDLDVFVSNGGVATNLGVDPSAGYLERYGMPDVLLLNDGKGGFDPAGAVAGPHFARALIGRGSAAGDLDNDGDIDIVVVNLGGAPVVLRNDAPPRHWITLRLVPAAGNRDAIGTRLTLTAGGRRQVAVVRGGGSYLSVNDRRPHFGLGDATRVERLEIVWPDGREQVLTDLAADRLLEVRQPQ